MALREKFGRLVLLAETDSSSLGTEYRAVRLGPSGFDRLVTVLRFAPRVSADAEVKKRLVEEARLAAHVHSAGLAKVLGIGVLGPAFYLSTELVEGRSVRTVLTTCRESGFPFGADHALMIASRAAAALEPLAGRKDEARQPLLHGLLAPSRLVVAFDGEVKVKGLGLWNALRESDLLGGDERAYLAPEQAAGRGDARSDVYALGLVLLEMLSGEPLEGGDPQQRLQQARIASPGGERVPLPPPLADLLRRALAADPAGRFAGLAELRKAVDALLFGGDFTPTTFDLAFFMHTLFRDEVEQEARAAEQARTADYSEFLSEEAGKAAARPPQTEPFDAARGEAPASPPTEAPPAAPTLVSPPTVADQSRGAAPTAAAVARPATGPDSSGARQGGRRDREAGAREAGAREAAARLSLGGGAAAPRQGLTRGAWLVIGLALAAVLGGGAGFLYFVGSRRAAEKPAPTPEQVAAEARVRELETRIAQLESEKAAAEASAAEEAKAALEKQAAAGGTTADPAAIAAAQEAARRRAREEQERRQREELERLAEEKRAEEQRLAEAAAALTAVEATPLPPAAQTPPPSPSPTPIAAAGGALSAPASHAAAPGGAAGPPPAATASSAAPSPVLPASPAPTPATTVAAGPIVETDPRVTPPVLVSQPKVTYPDIALAARVEGVVELRALVDESGHVADVTITRVSRSGVRFESAAERHVRGRRYKPATKDGAPVRTWIAIVVNFKLTR